MVAISDLIEKISDAKNITDDYLVVLSSDYEFMLSISALFISKISVGYLNRQPSSDNHISQSGLRNVNPEHFLVVDRPIVDSKHILILHYIDVERFIYVDEYFKFSLSQLPWQINLGSLVDAIQSKDYLDTAAYLPTEMRKARIDHLVNVTGFDAALLIALTENS